MTLTPQDFVSKWKRSAAREKQSVQEHFLDLCQLVGHPTPIEEDPSGTRFAFEMGAAKSSGGQGWADVAKLGYFGWEYKGKDNRDLDLNKAYEQLLRYRDALKNPPLLIVSDINTIIIRTNYTNLPTRTITLALDDLLTAEGLKTLRAVFFNPDELKPRQTVEAVTETAAREFSRLAGILRKYGEDDQRVAHFLIRLLFCLFAEDVGLLPDRLFPRLLEQTRHRSKDFMEVLRQLFRAMNTGGFFGADRILTFNGGLFDSDYVLELDGDGMDILAGIDALDWAAIEPSIFGTLFERGLDPAKRSQLGAHYTSRADILLIVEPVLMAPLRREWQTLKAEVEQMHVSGAGGAGKKQAALAKQIGAKLRLFADRIAAVQVLDPACGSGNFLYVALRLLLDLQNEVISLSDQLGAGRFFVSVTPSQLHGIEINAYAHELAQITIWIGYIQWLVDNGYGLPAEPILKPMQTILHMDAILTPTSLSGTILKGTSLNDTSIKGTSPKSDVLQSDLGEAGWGLEPVWPAADVIIGNPPFLGGNKIRAELGDKYVDALFKLYEGRVPAFADLVCYWFEKARAMIESGQVKRAGLLATNSIRGGVNRRVLERIKEIGDIFWAQSDREWVLDGAAVNVSMIGFDDGIESEKSLDNKSVIEINPDLTYTANTTSALRLPENTGICFMGPSPKAAFDIEPEIAAIMLKTKGNPNGRPNSDVIRPVASAVDIVQGSRNMWTIDFGLMEQTDAASYEMPFEYVKKVVYPVRSQNRRTAYAKKWWQYAEARPGMRTALDGKKRYIATPGVSKHRIFVWMNEIILCNQGTLVFAREDDYFFGVLQCKLHEIWALQLGTSLEDRPRYTPTTTFETFPFPWAPGTEPQADPRVQAIAAAAKELVEMRQRWLTPTALSGTILKGTSLNDISIKGTSPKSDVLQSDLGEAGWGSKRTLTALYNARPTWLELAHKKLDLAVFAAYGWPADLSDEHILERLLKLNLERAKTTTFAG